MSFQNHYQLQFGAYTGNAGDALSGSYHPEVQWWASHQGMKFSTRDRDNDRYDRNCAQEDKGGWWFNRFTSNNIDRAFHITMTITTQVIFVYVGQFFSSNHISSSSHFCMLFHLYSSRCHSANLNGFYYQGPYSAVTDDGIVWYPWHGWWYSLKSVQMKIRPAIFEPNDV